jgi:hypothetical protein
MGWYKTKGKQTKHLKQWHTDRGRYIVRWRDQYDGIDILAGYQALVKIQIEDRVILDSVWKFKVFRTKKAAMVACEDHAAGKDPAETARRRKYDKKMKPLKKRKEAKKKLVERDSIIPDAPKKRGRPKGSKNKVKA